jgi:hypothetical protein
MTSPVLPYPPKLAGESIMKGVVMPDLLPIEWIIVFIIIGLLTLAVVVAFLRANK